MRRDEHQQVVRESNEGLAVTRRVAIQSWVCVWAWLCACCTCACISVCVHACMHVVCVHACVYSCFRRNICHVQSVCAFCECFGVQCPCVSFVNVLLRTCFVWSHCTAHVQVHQGAVVNIEVGAVTTVKVRRSARGTGHQATGKVL